MTGAQLSRTSGRRRAIKGLLASSTDDAPMFPIKYSSIFRNRWIAVLWAAGIVWLALSFTAADEGAAPTANVTATKTDGTIADDTAEVRALVEKLQKMN